MALVRGLAFLSGIILFFRINALLQDSGSFSQPQPFLREASVLIPQIEKDYLRVGGLLPVSPNSKPASATLRAR